MAELPIVPIANVNSAIRPGLDIHRAKPAVSACNHVAKVFGPKRGLVRNDFAPHNAALERFDPKKLSVVTLRQRPSIINQKIMGEALRAIGGHRRKKTE